MIHNKLISYFMSQLGYMYEFKGLLYKEEDLQFHKSWDWLMPVVSKISNSGFSGNEDFIDSTERKLLFDSKERNLLLDLVPYGNIDDTYDAVVRFIKYCRPEIFNVYYADKWFRLHDIECILGPNLKTIYINVDGHFELELSEKEIEHRAKEYINCHLNT